MGEFFGGAEASGRDFSAYFFFINMEINQPFGFCVAGEQGIYGDILRSNFIGEAFHQSEQAGPENV